MAVTDRRGETIELAAVRKEGIVFSVPRPMRHDAAISLACEKLNLKCVYPGEEQGFVTSAGRFVDRKAAALIAYRQTASSRACTPKTSGSRPVLVVWSRP